MCDQWMTSQELPLCSALIDCLPRNPAWQYADIGGRLILWPRPCAYHARLPLQYGTTSSDSAIVPFRPEHVPSLEIAFHAAFRGVVPFAGLDSRNMAEAAHVSLKRTQDGQDGPLITPACFVAVKRGKPCGSALITLLPPGQDSDRLSYYWQETPSSWEFTRQGRPHLTWIFVHPDEGRLGLATTLLRHAAHALSELGFSNLLSTFLLGNDASLMWHWRAGFELLSGNAWP